ncbi:unnamed protein product [Paramecium octaurelia]|uniref:Uncharacterized protein n=1 Tax=Paramecium octaurelia TaxID=43137 RepID=A0A8S1U3V4_PAROT|nr:unnamed protein product [Paramecium octaurelia]
MEQNYIKLVIVGESGVGKTQILNSYCFGLAPQAGADFTIGCDYVLKRVLLNGKFLKLQIWDVSGAERESPLMKIYLKGALGIIFVFDATNEMSRQQLVKWQNIVYQYVDEYNGRHIPFLIVQNKMDLVQQYDEQNSQQFLQQFCQTFGFFDGLQCSAYDNQGLKNVFETIVDEIIRRDLVELQLKKNESKISKLQIEDKGMKLKQKSKCS